MCTGLQDMRAEVKENIRFATTMLTKDFFDEALYRPIFQIISQYYFEYAGLLDVQVFRMNVDAQANLNPEKKLTYKQKFQELFERNIRKDKFMFSVRLFKASHRDTEYRKVLSLSADAFSVGTEEGYFKSRKVLDQGLLKLDNQVREGSEESNMRESGDAFLAQWRKRRRDPRANLNYLPFHIPVLDDKFGGINLKETVFVAGAPGQYKSTWVRNLIHKTVLHGNNVVVGQGEMTNEQFKIGLYSIHSMERKFSLLHGIPKDAFKFPHKFLDQKEQEAQIKAVVQDFDSNPEYGVLHSFTFTTNFTVADLYRKFQTYQSQFNIDLVVIDELRHLESSKLRHTDREALGATVKELDKGVKSFNGGRGLRCVVLHKVNRENEKFAMEKGFYPLRALAESDETAKAANISIWVLQTEAHKGDNELKMGVNKARDGEGSFEWMNIVVPDTGYVSPKN